MSNLLDRATTLLFPEQGRRAIDVKFFNHSHASDEALAEQIVVCMAGIDDPSLDIEDIDRA